MSNKKHQEKGFTLAELMIAIFVFTIGILGAYGVIQQSAQFIKHASNHLTAAYLAQEGIEMIKNIRDTNFLEKHLGYDPSNPWEEGFGTEGCYEIDWYMLFNEVDPNILSCASRYLKIDANGTYNYSNGETTNFQREIWINSDGPDSKMIRVKVKWQEGSKNYEFETIEKIYNWL